MAVRVTGPTRLDIRTPTNRNQWDSRRNDELSSYLIAVGIGELIDTVDRNYPRCLAPGTTGWIDRRRVG